MRKRKLPEVRGYDEKYFRTFVTEPVPADEIETDTVMANSALDEGLSEDQKGPSTETVAPTDVDISFEPQRSKRIKRKITPDSVAQKRVLISLYANPHNRHQNALARLAGPVFTPNYVIRVAGKRAIGKFRLDGKYIPPSSDTMSGKEFAYASSKYFDGSLVEKLRKDLDPLGLLGKSALIRGQFEKVFWDELDLVLKEVQALAGD